MENKPSWDNPKIMYEAWSSIYIISRVTVVKETDNTVDILIPDYYYPRKKNKVTAQVCIFDSWEEAHDYLLEVAKHRLLEAQDCMERAQVKIEQIKKMEPLNEWLSPRSGSSKGA